MSTEQANGKTIEEKKDTVAEVNQKMENLAVDNTNEANESKGPRGGRAMRGRFRGRGGRTGGKFSPRPPYDEQVKQIADELASKKVLEQGVKGFVKWFSVKGRFGFLARENSTDDKGDVFVHQTAIIKSSTIKYYLRTLDDEEPVVFDIVEGRKGPEAANVTGPDGENVRGSRFARHLLQRYSMGRRGPPRGGNRKPRGENGEEKEQNEKTAEENGDGEARPQKKRRVRRARGKRTPEGEGADKGDAPQEKGDGDVATDGADGEKKGRRRHRHNHNNNNQKGKQEGSGEPAEQKQAVAPAEA